MRLVGLRASAAVVPVVAVAAFAVPSVVLGHGLGATYVSQLPLAVYLAGAAMTVALSFAFVLVLDLRGGGDPGPERLVRVPAALRVGLRALGLLAWLWIVAQAIAGGSSDADVASLFLWVYGWVGLALVSALVGPVWQWLDPFATLFDLGAAVARRLGIRGGAAAPYPERLDRWPAVAGFAFFVWLELVAAVGVGGRTLAIVLVAYTGLTLAMMAQFGRDTWRERGETFSVWFGVLGRLSPFAVADAGGTTLRRRAYAAGLLEAGWTASQVVLVALGTASILYDGLSQTEPWFAVFGAPGVAVETVLLLAFLGLIAGAAVAVARLVGVASIGAGLVPIATGYLVAHYLTFLIGDGQRILIAVSDPFQRGWDLFGTAFHEPSIAWLAPSLLWTIQLASVVGGHMTGAWAGPLAATRSTGEGIERGRARLRQVPLAVVMVALTTITLWSLGQAVVVEAAAAT